MIRPVELKRLSICPCGFSTLRDDISIGKIYNLETSSLNRALYVCGGCHRGFKVDVIQADNGLWLPRDLFTPLARTEEQSAKPGSEESANP